jgi:hypothetical protein
MFSGKIRPVVTRSSGALVALGVAAILSGCVVRVVQPAPEPPPPPPPPRAYEPPPPPPPAPAAEVQEEAQASEPPPPLPEYEQPACPGDGYLWTPGYWRWYAGGYYWVPGTWVMPPAVGVLWTPPYWGYVGGVYVFHSGYWGPHVGFYGGINYGYGYTGVGFVGGRWEGDRFAYNRSVVNVNNTVVHNTYNTTVVNNVTVVNRASYNGGSGGLTALPSAQERVAARENHQAATALQQQHLQQAVANPALSAHANGGRPAIAATARPASFRGPGVVGARGAEPAAANNFGASRAGQPGSANPSAGQRPVTAATPRGGMNAPAMNQPGARPAMSNSPQGQPGQPGQPGAARGAPYSATPRVPANGGGTAAAGYNARSTGGYAPPQQRPQAQAQQAPRAQNERAKAPQGRPERGERER